jgi:hemin uptake protein HemP
MIIIKQIFRLARIAAMTSKPRLPAIETSRPAASRPRIDSQALFGRESEIIIQHGDQEYRLRRTRNGRLILNK